MRSNRKSPRHRASSQSLRFTHASNHNTSFKAKHHASVSTYWCCQPSFAATQLYRVAIHLVAQAGAATARRQLFPLLFSVWPTDVKRALTRRCRQIGAAGEVGSHHSAPLCLNPRHQAPYISISISVYISIHICIYFHLSAHTHVCI